MINVLNITNSWGWSEMLSIALVGFGLVVVVLVGLVFVMKMFGIGIRNSRPLIINPAAEPVAAEPIISDEQIAAIATALKLYKREIHDRESEVITILNIKRAYSPWNSKIHGLTQLPDKR